MFISWLPYSSSEFMPLNSYYTSNAQANPGESYVSQYGLKWDDLTLISNFSETNLCIKAFTAGARPEAEFSSNVTSWVSPLTVQFTDLSKNAFSWEWDLNGDGTGTVLTPRQRAIT